MKKILTSTIVILVMTLFVPGLHAQTPGIQLLSAGDSSWNYNCTVPDTMTFMVYGTAYGYPAGDSVLIEIYFGDGTSTSFNTPIVQNTYFWDSNIQHVYTVPGNYSVMFIATGSDGDSDTLIDNTVLIAASCGNISGTVYIDNNGNCILDMGETLFPNVLVTAQYGGVIMGFTYTDSLGNYYLNLPSGFLYTIALNYTGATVTCPASGQHFVTSMPASGLNFGITCNTTFDLTANVNAQGFRTNNLTTFSVTVRNLLVTCVGPATTFTVTLDPQLTYVSSPVTPISVVGQQVTFNAGALGGIQTQKTFFMEVSTHPSAAIGDTLCITVEVDPIAGDAVPSNNIITQCYPVLNSFDPNEKHEVLAGTGTANILPGADLNYTIFFQNLGNDDAFDIYIIDTLHSNLDASTFRLVSYSHSPLVMVLPNNILKFEFKNINLPASSVNEPLSHGFINYTISALPGLTQGSVIENTAHIYFDFNPAIVTNTVTHIVDLSSGIDYNISNLSLVLFPNPAHDYFMIQQNETDLAEVRLYNSVGKLVMNELVTGSGKISVTGLPQGLYFIELFSNGINERGKLVIH